MDYQKQVKAKRRAGEKRRMKFVKACEAKQYDPYTRGKKRYHVRTRENVLVPVDGYEIRWDILPGYTFFVHRGTNAQVDPGRKDKKPWTVSETSTGIMIPFRYNVSYSKKDTVNAAYSFLKFFSSDKVSEAIEKEREKLGLGRLKTIGGKEPHQPDTLIMIETEIFKITLDHPSYILQVKTVRNPEVISPRILMSLGWRYVKGHKPPGTWRTENLSVIRDTVKTIKGGKNNE